MRQLQLEVFLFGFSQLAKKKQLQASIKWSLLSLDLLQLFDHCKVSQSVSGLRLQIQFCAGWDSGFSHCCVLKQAAGIKATFCLWQQHSQFPSPPTWLFFKPPVSGGAFRSCKDRWCFWGLAHYDMLVSLLKISAGIWRHIAKRVSSVSDVAIWKKCKEAKYKMLSNPV